MEVFNRQEVLTASLDPLFLGQGLAFGAVPIPARVIRYRQMAAVIALILMTTKGSGSACLDGAHNPQMIAGQSMRFSIDRSVLTENLRHFKVASCSHPLFADYEGCFVFLSRGLVTCDRFSRLTCR